MTTHRLVWLLATIAGVVATRSAASASAQRAVKTPLNAPESAPVSSLDAWLVSRFHGAQLLTDSTPTSASAAAESLLPRVEGVRPGRSVDTLYAIHFGVRLGTPALAVKAVAQLTGPTGTITPLTARVVSRRAFRAPRRPGALSSAEGAWRYGWSYQVVLPRRAISGAKADNAIAVSRYRGWLLLAPTDAKSTRALLGR